METIIHSLKRNGSVLILYFITIVIVQMLCNIDSYLYMQVIGQFDSAVFFMSGKALMNGMIPYTDFTDSKGILLWFMYGMGYLLDHYSYVGVFWIMCCLLFSTLCITYKTARLFLSRQLSIWAALWLLIPLMYWNFYIETKAEHFCWPAVALGLYVLMKSINGRTIRRRDYFCLGASIVWCLMIKWNVAIMMLSFFVSLIWLAWKNGSLKHCLWNGGLGIVVALMPFVVYFTWVGNWQDMWQEYFVNTIASVTTEDTSIAMTLQLFFNGWKQLFSTRMFLYLLYTLPAIVLWKRKQWFSTALPVLCGLFFLALSTRESSGSHYVTVAGPFAIITIIVLVMHVELFRKYILYTFILGIVYVTWGNIYYSHNFCTKDRVEFNKFMALSATMSRVSEHPTVIVLGMEPCLCMGTALPGTRYWTLQKGRTNQMWQDELHAIKSGSSDFIIFWMVQPEPYTEMLATSGYHYLGDYFNGCVYTKHNLNKPEKIKDISIKDIILKRTYEEIYEENHDTYSVL